MTCLDDGRKRVSGEPLTFCPGANVIAAMREAHDEKLALCDRLEELADTLPLDIDAEGCLALGNAICPLLRSIHVYEEEAVYPLYEAKQAGRAQAAEIIARLKVEHFQDDALAEEIADALMRIGSGAAIESAETVGFMLRAFFQSIRRHVAFERDHMLALLEGEI